MGRWVVCRQCQQVERTYLTCGCVDPEEEESRVKMIGATLADVETHDDIDYFIWTKSNQGDFVTYKGLAVDEYGDEIETKYLTIEGDGGEYQAEYPRFRGWKTITMEQLNRIK